jgi:3-methylcrotonyl-CoA carboxylase alpha subunit
MSFVITLDGARHEVEILARRPHLKLRVEGRIYEVRTPGGEEDGRHAMVVSAADVRFTRVQTGDRQMVRMGGRTFETALVDPRADSKDAAGGHDHIRAPMPGSIVRIHAEPGALVQRGQTIVTIESMKLQMALIAPRDGRLATVTRAVGETFDKDEIVAELEPVQD